MAYGNVSFKINQQVILFFIIMHISVFYSKFSCLLNISCSINVVALIYF